MKRLLPWLSALLLTMCVLCIPARAESAASSVDLQCSVTSEGDCLVTMTVMLRLETAHSTLTFPLPAQARDIKMNGSNVTSSRSESSIDVDISRIVRDYVGEATVQFTYTIPEAVQVETDLDENALALLGGRRPLVLEIPLLSGFEYPVESLTFTITMPGSNLTNPAKFTSIYRQESVASDLTVITNGNQIIGSSKTTLNDHDGITMTMEVPQEMFPTVSTYVRVGNPELVPMLISAGVALVYWLVFLFSLPLVRQRTSTPLEGVTAGEMGCRLTQSGADLTMMVFTWAQLGYILIQADGERILLHKRMEMGNERGPFENKVFGWLFGGRRTVDATGLGYARLCQRVLGQVPNAHNMYKTTSGNITLFRILACVSQVFAGVCVAMNMSTVPVLQVLMALILGIFGAVSAWLIQAVAYRTHLRGKVPVYVGMLCVLIWLVLGLLCGQIWIPFLGALGQWLAGYLAAYGGRRSDLGRHDGSLVLGLRYYLKHLPRSEISRLMANDPDYFFNLAPYALALGVINPFSAAFGRRMLDQCPYLMTRIQGRRTAEDWGHIMADVADRMDKRSRQMQVEKLLTVQFAYLRQPRRRQARPARTGSRIRNRTKGSSD